MNLIQVLTNYLKITPPALSTFGNGRGGIQLQEHFTSESFQGYYIVYTYVNGVPFDLNLLGQYESLDFDIDFNIWGLDNGGVTRAAKVFEDAMKGFKYREGKKVITCTPIRLYIGFEEKPYFRKLMEYRFIVQ